tara:strand:- start:5 stop:199 length:195 start_codon:yes stop_codon:yes gene_type:complete
MMQRRHFDSLAEHLAHIDIDAKMTKGEIIHFIGAWCSTQNPAFNFVRFQDYVIAQSRVLQQEDE